LISRIGRNLSPNNELEKIVRQYLAFFNDLCVIMNGVKKQNAVFE